MKRTSKQLTAALLAVLTASGLTLPALAETTKDEVLYANLGHDGSLRDLYVVNAYDSDSPARVTDHGDYADLRNLTTTERLENRAGSVDLSIPAGRFYYQGTLTNRPLPWIVSVSYRLDGKPLDGAALAGQSGHLELTLDLQANPSVDTLYADNFALQTTILLDSERCKNIEAPDATSANVGSNRQLSYILLPGKTRRYTVTADVTNFEMDGIQINGIPLTLDIDDPDTSEVKDKIYDLQSGAQDLDDGAGTLGDGVEELWEGSLDLQSGVAELADGAKSLRDGTGDLWDGAQDLGAGAGKLARGAKDLRSGSRQLYDGARSLYEKSGQLAEGSAKITAGFTALGESGTELRAGIEQFQQSAAGMLGVPVDELDEALAEQIAQLEEQLAQLPATLEETDAYTRTLSDVVTADGADTDVPDADTPDTDVPETDVTPEPSEDQEDSSAPDADTTPDPDMTPDIDMDTDRDLDEELDEELDADMRVDAQDQAPAANDAAISRMLYTAARGELEAQLAQLRQLQDMNRLLTGMSTYLKGVDQVGQGAAAIDGGVHQLHDGSKTLYDGMATLYDGVVELKNGTSELQDGTRELRDGVKDLRGGMESLYDGTDELRDGTDRLYDGAAVLRDGSFELRDGTTELRGQSADMDAKVDEEIDRMLEEYRGKPFEMTSFVSPENGTVHAVQFVMRTADIEIVEQPAPEEAPVPAPTFWQRVRALFPSRKD